MNTAIRSVGIIGLGDFGRFVASLLPDDVRVWGTDTHANTLLPANVQRAELAVVAAADVVVVAVPLEALEAVLGELRQHLRPTTLVMDVCSVKVAPEALFAQYLGGHPNVLLTHPLFGPQSAAQDTAGHELIVTKSQGEVAEHVLAVCEQRLKLRLIRQNSERHDKIMAQVHVLTFFVARGLGNLQLESTPFKTPSYGMIEQLVALDATHSEELFQTIQKGNPFAKEMRQRLMRSLAEVDKGLGNGV